MRRNKLARLCVWGTIFFAVFALFGKQAGAAPTSGTFYWTNFGNANAYGYGFFSWEIIDTLVPPSDDRESAVVATLPAGNYTGVVRGKGNATGIGLVEVYSLQ